MAKGITEKEPDPRIVYGDIIDLPHWESKKHPHMSLYDRAAQFAPFAALTGYDDMVREEARLVDSRIELTEDERERLRGKLNRISDMLSDGLKPIVSITCFIADHAKDGGRYETLTATVRKVDSIGRQLVLEQKTGIAGECAVIKFEDIFDIHGDKL